MQASETVPNLSYATTVAKNLVHRRAVSEVYLTDCRSAGHDTFAVGAHLPRAHRYYNDLMVDQHDVMILFEVCRQAGILIAHTHYGVPVDWAFIFRFGDAPIQPGALAAVPLSAQDASVVVRMVKVYSDDGAVTGAKIKFDVAVGGVFFGTYDGSMSFLPRDLYSAFRDGSRANVDFNTDQRPAGEVTELEPRSVGRTDPSNVVIGRDNAGALWLVDKPHHPALCDHEVDHVSGMVLFEAVRQAAISFAPDGMPNPSRFRVKFLAFAEKDLPLEIKVDKRDAGYEVSLDQAGRPVTAGYVEFARAD